MKPSETIAVAKAVVPPSRLSSAHNSPMTKTSAPAAIARKNVESKGETKV